LPADFNIALLNCKKLAGTAKTSFC
jgi:hypothetical protein